MNLNLRPSADGFGMYLRRAVRIYVLSVVITTVFVVAAMALDLSSYLRPHLSISLVLGILFGPFASLGVDTVSLFTNLYDGNPLDLVALDLFTTFIVSYIPYRMWYSTALRWTNEDSCPSLGTVHNVVKFILVMTATAVVYTVLYNYTYSLLYGTFEMGYDDLSIMLSVISFSLVFGMAAIIILRYLGVRPYSPHRMFQRDDFRSRINPLVFDIALIIGMMAWLIVPALEHSESVYEPMAISYALVFFFLTKPVTAYDEDDSYLGIKRCGFDGIIIERIIVIFIVIGLSFGLVSGFAAYNGILADILDHGNELSAVFYMGATTLAFFAVATALLWYVERRVSIPLWDISQAARNFVGGDREGMSYETTVDEYSKYRDYNSEVGVLARSLVEMTEDIKTYIEDIRNLNSAREAYISELGVARTIQESLIPKNFDSVSGMGVDVHGAMIAAKYVGGDLYDFFKVSDDHLAVAIGDVSGKGMPAALFMAVTKSLLESGTGPGTPPEDIVSGVNDSLCRNNDEGMFVTAWFGILETSTGKLSFVNAGHCPPILLRPGSEPTFVRTKPGLVLGGMEGFRYRCETMVLEPGDRLILYTDGVTEANSDYEEFYGEERLASMVAAHASDSVSVKVTAIVDDVLKFTGDSEQFDDITVFVLEYHGRT